jgi:hypothetical protein
MADNARFHNKLHRTNHHTIPTDGYPDSAIDPIASPDFPFQGDMVLANRLSAADNVYFDKNLTIQGNLSVYGDYSYFETHTTTTSSMSVFNYGSGPALTVVQYGNQPIARFIDGDAGIDGTDAFFIENTGQIIINGSVPVLDRRVSIAGSLTASGNTEFQAGSAFGSRIFAANSGVANTVDAAAFGTSRAANVGAFATGNNNFATGSGSFVWGTNNVARGDTSIAGGDSTWARASGSHTEGFATSAFGVHSHAEGVQTYASAAYSHAEGIANIASGIGSHVEGLSGNVSGQFSHVEGIANIVLGQASHAEGYANQISNNAVYSHAEGALTNIRNVSGGHTEGIGTFVNNNYTHAEGYYTSAIALYSHSEGMQTLAQGQGAHAEGRNTIALGNYSNAVGHSSVASGLVSQTVGQNTSAYGDYSNASGYYSVARGVASRSENNATSALGDNSISSGTLTKAYGINSQAIGESTIAIGRNSFTAGTYTAASGQNAAAFGDTTFAGATGATTFGYLTTAYGLYSIATGVTTKTTSSASFVGGTNSIIISAASDSFAYGYGVSATGMRSAAFGDSTNASGSASFASGYGSVATGKVATALGFRTSASGVFSTAIGEETRCVGDTSLATGERTVCVAPVAYTAGTETSAYAVWSHVVGYRTISLEPATGCFVGGYYSSAMGALAVSYGLATSAYGNGSFAQGHTTAATGSGTIALGRWAQAKDDFSYVWSGDTTTNVPIKSTKTSQYMISAPGGVYIPGNVGIGTDNNDETSKGYNLSVGGSISASGNMTLLGNLSVYGDLSYLETIISVTSALSVVNTGVGPALFVSQKGAYPIARFVDADGAAPGGVDALFIENNGQVVLNGSAPSEDALLTIYGNASARGNLSAYNAYFYNNIAINNTVSALYVNVNTLTARFIDMVHGLANDGYNPTFNIGEVDTTIDGGTTTRGFSGFTLLYDEGSNVLSMQTSFSAGNLLSAYEIDRRGFIGLNVHPQERFSVAGTISASNGLSANNGYFANQVGIATPYKGNLDPAIALTVYGAVSASNGLSGNNGYYANNVGIKINNPLETLTINGTISASNGLSANNGYFANQVGIATPYKSALDTSIALTVFGSISASNGLSANNGYHAGNVGIKINNPLETLTVAGTVSASNGLSANNGYFANQVGIATPYKGNLDPNVALTVYGSVCASNGLSGSNLYLANNQVFAGSVGTKINFYGNVPVSTTPEYAIGVQAGELRISAGSSPGKIALYSGGQAGTEIAKTDPLGLTIGTGGLTANYGYIWNNFTVGSLLSAETVSVNTLTARYIDMIHGTANDGVNPIMNIGETDPTIDGGTTTRGFSGFTWTYDEGSNVLSLQTSFSAGNLLSAYEIDRRGYMGFNAHPQERLHVNGNTFIVNSLSAGGGVIGTWHSLSGSVSEGFNTKATGKNAHAEGRSTTASGDNSHAEGQATQSIGGNSHAEGNLSLANGITSHAAGYRANALQNYTWAWSDGSIAGASPGTALVNATTTRTGQMMVSASGGVFLAHTTTLGVGTDIQDSTLTVVGTISASSGLSANNGYLAGSVGIGINNPLAKLSVAGSISASGGLSASNINGPVFSVYNTAVYPISTGTGFSVLSADGTEFNIGGGWVTQNKFQPSIPGYYQINGGISFASMTTSTGKVMVALYKNSVEYRRGSRMQAYTGGIGAYVNSIVYLNGLTDYIQLAVLQDTGAYQTIENSTGQYGITLNGSMIRGM